MNANEPADRRALPASSAAADPRLPRLEELRRDLAEGNSQRRAYALETLLAQLWVETGQPRLAVACALCGYSPSTGEEAASESVARLLARLPQTTAPTDLPAVPERAALKAWVGQALRGTLTGAVDALKALARTPQEADAPRIRREAEVCEDTLALARLLPLAEAAEAAVRLLRLFPPDLARATGPLARQTLPLREAAARTLGALSPDTLFAFWYTLGSPDATARRDLMPALDYLHDPRAVPYLVRLLERRSQWADGEMVAWFVVRAFERIRDRRALPALRRLAASGPPRTLARPGAGAPGETSEELAREARRVIQAIETGRDRRERAFLLRPVRPPAQDLLRASASPPEDLLRPAAPASESLLRPAETRPQELLQPAQPSPAEMLRPAASTPDGERPQDRTELLRPEQT